MMFFGKFLIGLGGTVVVLAAAALVGLQIRPQPFEPYPQQTPELQRRPLPSGLPAPVDRFYRAIMGGDQAPVIESAVLTGRGHLRIAGVRFPSRWRFTHEAGQNYRHYIEATVFGRPLFKVNEHFLDGNLRMELPTGVVENDPKTNEAANLALWGESIFLPSVLVLDPRVRWEPVDETRARLVIPWGSGTDAFDVTFDPETGLIISMNAMRWKETTSSTKTGWRLDVVKWDRFGGVLLPAVSTVTWADEKQPWFVMDMGEVVYNVDVSTYIRAEGP